MELEEMIEIVDQFEQDCRDVQKAAYKFGGSFNRAIFGVLPYADMGNKLKIKNTWLAEWTHLLELLKEYQKKVDTDL